MKAPSYRPRQDMARIAKVWHPTVLLVHCSCGVGLNLKDADGHERRNPGHVVEREGGSVLEYREPKLHLNRQQQRREEAREVEPMKPCPLCCSPVSEPLIDGKGRHWHRECAGDVLALAPERVVGDRLYATVADDVKRGRNGT